MKNGILLLPAGIASLRVAEYPGSFAAHTHDELIDNTRRVLWPAIKDALTRPLGEGDVVRSRLESIWGGMLDRGATTFWEQWPPERKGDAIYNFYGRPFGLALCHATATGPLFLLPMLYAEHPANPFGGLGK